MAGINCCYNCPDRTVEPNCHMTCEKYLAQKEALEKTKKQIEQQKDLSWGLTAQRKRLYYYYKKKNHERNDKP